MRNGTAYTVSVPKRQPAPAQASQEATVVEIDQLPTNGRGTSHSAPVKVIDWRRTRGQITEDGRILVQMSDGTHNPPWLELDDAGQHWILDMIQRAQEVRA